MNSPNIAMTPEDLEQFIFENHIEATILSLAEHTPTVADAARVLGAKTDQIIKSLIFMANGNPVLAINNGLCRIDRQKLADSLELNSRKVRFASPEQALFHSGYIVGSMPPFGHLQPLPTFVDKAVTGMELIFAGGGGINAMMRLTPAELLRVTQAKVVDISDPK